MTLTRLLGIDLKLVHPEQQRSLSYAERVWRENGCPTENGALVELIERILVGCKHEGIAYAPILLRRKKELQQGTWTPSAEPQLAIVPKAIIPKVTAGRGCAECQGRGYRFTASGATLCECGAWRGA